MKSKLSALPYIIRMAAFTIIPLVLIVVFAFTTADGAFYI